MNKRGRIPPKKPPTAVSGASDSGNFSDAGRIASLVSQMDSIRVEKVDQAREKLQNPGFDTPERVQEALRRAINEIV